MRVEYTNGVYDGSVDYNDDPDGYGTFRWDDGDVYDGYWRHDQRCGHGTFRSHEGWSYSGDYYNDEMHGYGRYTFDDGGYYDGEFSHDKFNGHGKRVYPSGGHYEGSFRDDMFHGHGKMVYSDGTYYDGEWRGDEKNGRGKETFSDGEYYDGEWKDGKRNGYGYCKYSNGDTYEGYWKDGVWCGNGKLIQTDGAEIEGRWMDCDNADDVLVWYKGGTIRFKIRNRELIPIEEKKIHYANKGSTAKIIPQNLVERLVLEEVIKNPFTSDARVLDLRMTDSRWPAFEGWVKMERVVHIRRFQGNEVDVKITVHYVANKIDYSVDDFKIKSVSQ